MAKAGKQAREEGAVKEKGIESVEERELERRMEEEDDSEVEVWVVDDEEDAGETGGEGRPAAGADESERLRQELAEVRDQWMRTVADLDNFRKRSEREVRELRRYALFETMRDFLSIVDNLERALAADGSVEDLKRGVEMILAQMKETMKTHGVREVPAAGAPFDPTLHDAVSRHEEPEVEAPTVSEELQRGYTMHERLLRPALVKVAMPAPQPAPSPAGGEAEAGDEG